MSDLRVLRRSSGNGDVWLLSRLGEEEPRHVRVLDRSLGRLFPFVDASIAMSHAEWEDVPDDEAPGVAELLAGVDQMPAQDPTSLLGSAAARAVSNAES
jgi:hypothetical protein